MKLSWVKIIGIFASMLSILWLIGLSMTFTHYFNRGATAVNNPVETVEEDNIKDEPTIDNTDGIHVVALGDSLTFGTGDVDENGYVGYVVNQLSDNASEDVTVTNFAINGLTSEGLLEVILRENIKEQLKQADILLLTIGGNDLFRRGQALIDLNLDEITIIEQQFLRNLTKILTDIRELNSEVPIYYSGLYHPFTHLPNVEVTTKVIMGWNYQTQLTIANFPHVYFVPMYDLFQDNLDSYLSEDRFHPSKEGYEQMANRIFSLLRMDGEENE